MIKLLRLILQFLYRFQAYNEKVLTTPGPVLLIPNHVSWFDWLFLGVCLDSDWKFVVSSVVAQKSPFHRFVMLNNRTFPIDPASPYAVKRMAEHLSKNGRLVLFAEGRISKTGSLMKLFEGTGFLIKKTNAKVITAYLRGAYQLPFCPSPAPRKYFPEVTVHFSEVLTAPECHFESTSETRSFLTHWLGDQMVAQEFQTEMTFGPHTVHEAILERARSSPGIVCLEDVTRKQLSYRTFLTSAYAMGSALKDVKAGESGRVGVILPNMIAMPVTLLGLWFQGKVPAVFNFSTGVPTILACAKLADIRTVVTSRLFLEKARINLDALVQAGIEIQYLEDVRTRIGFLEKIRAAIQCRLELNWPSASKSPAKTELPAVILFTSGSEGVPKGVQLSHTNVLANMRQMLAVTDIMDNDRMFNCLPLFHSFGLVVGTLLPLVRGLYTFLYVSPLHYRVIPGVFYDTDCTIFLGTNTFLNGYARKADPYDFRTLRYLFSAAEKLQEATASTWATKFGVRILEGYGATECSPCLSINTPLRPSPGTVGRLLPGIEHRIEPIEGVSEGGRLWVRGPNVMMGYLNLDANAEFHKNEGWYDTGDIVKLDPQGNLLILGRLKRFAKVSGEMVSLTAVEDALAGAFPQYGLRCQIAVVTRPDPGKGEALIAVSNEPNLKLDEIRAVIRARGLSNLSAPREIRVVKSIPKLGTGKIDHRQLVRMLEENKG